MSPFDPIILNHNEAQLDFILQMYVKDNPKGPLRIERPGQPDASAVPEVRWADVLSGSDYERYMAKQMPPQDVLDKLRARHRALNPAAPMAPPVRMGPQSSG